LAGTINHLYNKEYDWAVREYSARNYDGSKLL
jgi:hypothetical protein